MNVIKFHLMKTSQIILTSVLIRLHNIRVGKTHPRTSHEGPEGEIEIELYPFFNLSAKCEWVVNATPRLLSPGKETRYP
jgi:hypothetical protein